MPASFHSDEGSPTRTERRLPAADHPASSTTRTLTVPGREPGATSPFRSTFSFEKKDRSARPLSAESDLVEDKQIARPIKRGAPGDAALMSMVQRSPEEVQQCRRKSSFYGDVFAYRESPMSARDRVSRESVVMAEVKTNVIIKDEYTIIMDLSHQLSLRYSRPESLIMVNLVHSACLLLGGSFDPAYTITITALPAQVQAVTNKRNAALTQSFMNEVLGVPAHRGVVKFVAIAEENYATNGQTVLGAMEALDKNSPEEGTSRKSSVAWARNEHRKKSLAGLSMHTEQRKKSFAGGLTPHDQNKKGRTSSSAHSQALPEESEVPAEQLDVPPESALVPVLPVDHVGLDPHAEKMQKISKRKSFLAMFGK